MIHVLAAGALLLLAPAAHALHLDRTLALAAPPARAWAVLTDYAGMPAFIRSMVSSTELERSGGKALVAQVAEGRLLFFSRRLTVVLRVREDRERTIAFEDVSHASFVSYRGSWTVSPAGAGAVLRYVLDAEPSFWLPGFLLDAFVRHAVDDLLDEVRVEILRRAAT